MFVSQVQKFLKENQGLLQTTLSEQREINDGGSQEAEDSFTGGEEQTKQSPSDGNTETKREDRQDADCRMWIQPQQETDHPSRQLTCLDIPDFLQLDGVEGRSGNTVSTNLFVLFFALVMKCIYLCVCGKK